MNAANEVAVAAFLAGACGFLDIERTVESGHGRRTTPQPLESLEQVEIDAWARRFAGRARSPRSLRR